MVQTYFSMGGMILCKWKNILEFYFRNRNREGRERLESKEVSEFCGLKGNVKPHDTLILMKITTLSQNLEVAVSCAIPHLEASLKITVNLPELCTGFFLILEPHHPLSRVFASRKL